VILEAEWLLHGKNWIPCSRTGSVLLLKFKS
jgi:hypothetical protein